MAYEAVMAFLMIGVVGLLSLVGLFFISVKEHTLDKILFYMVAFATGTIVATALFDLLPEALHHLEELNTEGADFSEGLVFVYLVIGFIIFFILERFIYWFHGHAHEEANEYVCHGDFLEGTHTPAEKGSGTVKGYVFLNLIGDGLHNFLDGIIIMVSFLVSLRMGFIVMIAIILHEIPQEIGDFGILLYGGLSKKKALFFNFLSAMVAMAGGILAFLLSGNVEVFNLFFLAFSAGGFLYIGCCELMPEMLKEKNLKKSILQAIIFILGILFIYNMIISLPHE